MKIELHLPESVPSQNETEHWHWGHKKSYSEKLQKTLRMLTNALPAVVKEQMPPSSLVKVHVHSMRCRSLDYGNLVGGSKILIDALRYTGVIKNDDTLSIQESYSQAAVLKSERETVVTVSWGDGGPSYRVELNSRGL